MANRRWPDPAISADPGRVRTAIVGQVPGLEQAIRFTRIGERQVAWSSVGSGPPLVIGWWMSHLELDWSDPLFRAFVGMLAEHRTVIRYDRPGTGLSDPDGPLDTAVDAEVSVLSGIVDAVAAPRSSGPVALLGGSYGGPIAATYAARAPDRVERLVLYGSYADGSQLAAPDVRSTLISIVETHWGLGSRVLADVFLPGATPAERDAFARFQRASASAAVAARSLAAVYDIDVREELARIAAPTLVLHRRDDQAIPFALGRELSALVPGATFVPLTGRDHLPWRGDAAGVARAALEFLGAQGIEAPAVSPSDPQSPIGELTARELEVLVLVAGGLGDREIARRLVLSPHTVHRHVANIRTKLGLPSRAAAAAYATRIGVI